jgi:hypothetical protein
MARTASRTGGAVAVDGAVAAGLVAAGLVAAGLVDAGLVADRVVGASL